jgi:hypothetical protein
MVEVSGMSSMSPMGGINPGVSQNLCEVISNKKIGAYHHISLAAPAIAEHAKPGNFVAISVGDVRTSMLLRRSFAIYQTVPRGPFGGTLEIIVAPNGPGSTWISERQPHEKLDVVGPLGNQYVHSWWVAAMARRHFSRSQRRSVRKTLALIWLSAQALLNEFLRPLKVSARYIH